MYITKEVEVDVAVEDVVKHMSEREKDALATSLKGGGTDASLRAFVDRMRMYARAGDLPAFLKCAEDMAWRIEGVVIDTTRLRESAHA